MQTVKVLGFEEWRTLREKEGDVQGEDLALEAHPITC